MARELSVDVIEQGVKLILVGMGEDPDREGLKDTPNRIAKFYSEWLRHAQYNKMTAFESTYDNMVIVKHVPFYSLCEHHLLPFIGHACVGYIPSKKVLGLSKLVRIIDKHSRKLQIQENLTVQIADDMVQIIKPKGVMVVIEAEHLCMSMRGVEVPGTKTITSAIRGVFCTMAPRQEFLNLIRHNGV